MIVVRFVVGILLLYWCVLMPTLEHLMVRMQTQATVKLCVRDNDKWYLKLESDTFHCDLMSLHSYAMQSNINVIYIPTSNTCQDVTMFRAKIQNAIQRVLIFFTFLFLFLVVISRM